VYDDRTDEILGLLEETPEIRAVLFGAIGLVGPVSSIEEAAEDIVRFLASADLMRQYGIGSPASWLDRVCADDGTDWIVVAARLLELAPPAG
jgi:hypothetical protein